MTKDTAEATVTALSPREPVTTPTLFGTSDPVEVVVRATRHARALASVIEDRGLYTKISGRNHVRVEGWTLLGSMVGVFAVPVWSRPVPEDWRDRGLDGPEGWQARVEARTINGQIVGAATASCMRSESNWASRDEYALESMAQTRATSKALRLPLGFVIVLAGYDATPAEELDGVAERDHQQGAQGNRERPKPDPETERKRQLFDALKARLGGVKGVHDAYRAAYNVTGGVKSSDLTVEVLERLTTLIDQAQDGGAVGEISGPDAEIVEGEIVEATLIDPE